MKRKIITIHEELCNGCGVCVDACHEGAIELVDGIAKLVSDIYCDGLGDCLKGCPTGAIEIIEREAEDYDDEAVQARMAARNTANGHSSSSAHAPHMGHTHAHHPGHAHAGGGCPGSMAQRIRRDEAPSQPAFASAAPVHNPAPEARHAAPRPSELNQWPIQIHLVNPANPYFDDADLLIAADCTSFAYADFHKDFIRGRITLIGCPKLDDVEFYTEKLTTIFRQHNIRSVTVARMSVPCCGGIVQAVKRAMLNAQTIVPYREAIIGIDGTLETR
ncbi:ATP-binding protein [Gorillibacterium massiliense]|uniref:ATP-binding protein n=1 Tax=Gorillibacterium massiliense TaxID=1280390 RepID=UPI0004B32273|nr:4Fe-4S dicluster domain-containing protein [Gorillibacterium massiliense]